jgi:hypothetical protein
VSVAYVCKGCGEWMRLWCHCCGLCLHEPEGPQCCKCTALVGGSSVVEPLWKWLKGLFNE